MREEDRRRDAIWERRVWRADIDVDDLPLSLVEEAKERQRFLDRLEIGIGRESANETRKRERRGRGGEGESLELTEKDSRPDGHVDSVGDPMNSYRCVHPDPKDGSLTESIEG